MKLGILGLPGAGKSTLFDLVTESLEGPDFSHAPNRPRVKVVKVRDPRLDRLRDDYKPRTVTPASLEVVDFPGVRGDGPRSGVADLLAPAREMDALFVVLRGFDAAGLPARDPLRDLEEVCGELLITDLVLVENRLERLCAKSRKPSFTKDDAAEQDLLERLQAHLEADKALSSLDLAREDEKRIGGFGFLSAKPQVVTLNVSDAPASASYGPVRAAMTAEVIVVSAKNELEILGLEPEERPAFLEEYGIDAMSRDTLIQAGYRASRRISFFTAGEKEVRAWTIRAGTTAVEAAGEIHTDMARGFIRAEVVSHADYERFGSVKGARVEGHLRLEGKEYVVQDGDLIEFRFSV